jgi:predicted nucleotidyltransferase
LRLAAAGVSGVEGSTAVLVRRDQVIANRPAVEVRDALKRLRFFDFSILGAARELRYSPAEAQSFVEDLVAEGFIGVGRQQHAEIALGADEDYAAVSLYGLTLAGYQLARARIGNPITRAKAQQLLDGVIQRVQAVNANDDWLYWVDELVLFGSFSRDGSEPVGDVDLAIDLRPRQMTDAEWARRVEEIAARDNVRLATSAARDAFPFKRVSAFLRGPSGRVDLIELRNNDAGLPPAANRIAVYERERSNRSPA